MENKNRTLQCKKIKKVVHFIDVVIQGQRFIYFFNAGQINVDVVKRGKTK